MIHQRLIAAITMALVMLLAAGQTSVTDTASTSLPMQEIGEVTVTTRRPGMSRVAGAENTMRINKAELFKAACCNLGESFPTNPSVDRN
jgi:hypothetical protein